MKKNRVRRPMPDSDRSRPSIIRPDRRPLTLLRRCREYIAVQDKVNDVLGLARRDGEALLAAIDEALLEE